MYHQSKEAWIQECNNWYFCSFVLSADEEKDSSDKSSDDESEENKSKEPVKPPELQKYWEAVRNHPGDFTGWTYLLQYVEQKVD